MWGKAKENEQRAAARARIERYIGRGKKIYTLTAYTRGETDYVRVFVAEDSEIKEITFDVGAATAIRTVNTSSQYGIVMQGAQYNKALEVVDALYRLCSQTLDQEDWREL